MLVNFPDPHSKYTVGWDSNPVNGSKVHVLTKQNKKLAGRLKRKRDLKWIGEKKQHLLPFPLVFPEAPVARLSIFPFLLVSCQNLLCLLSKNPHPSVLWLLLLVQAGIHLCQHLLVPLRGCWLRGSHTCLKENSPRRSQACILPQNTHSCCLHSCICCS